MEAWKRSAGAGWGRKTLILPPKVICGHIPPALCQVEEHGTLQGRAVQGTGTMLRINIRRAQIPASSMILL
jgi:hypothetical protein